MNAYPLLEAIFLPGRALELGEALGVFKPESLRLLREQAEQVEDAIGHAAELALQAATQRLIGQL